MIYIHSVATLCISYPRKGGINPQLQIARIEPISSGLRRILSFSLRKSVYCPLKIVSIHTRGWDYPWGYITILTLSLPLFPVFYFRSASISCVSYPPLYREMSRQYILSVHLVRLSDSLSRTCIYVINSILALSFIKRGEIERGQPAPAESRNLFHNIAMIYIERRTSSPPAWYINLKQLVFFSYTPGIQYICDFRCRIDRKRFARAHCTPPRSRIPPYKQFTRYYTRYTPICIHRPSRAESRDAHCIMACIHRPSRAERVDPRIYVI